MSRRRDAVWADTYCKIPAKTSCAIPRPEYSNRTTEWRHSHDDKNGAYDHALDASSENGIGDNGEGLIDDHVGKEEGDEEKVAIFADGLDFVGIFAL